MRLSPARVATEAGTHSIWISEQLQELGHEVIVANVRELRAISHSDRKSDDFSLGIATTRPRPVKSAKRQNTFNAAKYHSSSTITLCRSSKSSFSSCPFWCTAQRRKPSPSVIRSKSGPYEAPAPSVLDSYDRVRCIFLWSPGIERHSRANRYREVLVQVDLSSVISCLLPCQP
jgi:hypothetical protein